MPNDSLWGKTRSRISQFGAWCNQYGVKGYVGEVGVPHDEVLGRETDGPLWADILDRWYRSSASYSLWTTAWATGPWWGDYNLLTHDLDEPKHPTSTGVVVEKYASSWPTVTVDRFTLTHAGSEGAGHITPEYRIEGRADGGTWNVLVSVTGNTDNNPTHILAAPVEVRELRLFVTDPSTMDNATRIYDFKARLGDSGPDLAQGKPVIVSGTANAATENGPNLVDGNISTKWADNTGAAGGDDAWAIIQVSPPNLATLRGVNMSSGEYGALPGTYDVDYTYADQTAFDYIAGRGIRLVRLPFKWERLQTTLNGTLNATEVARLKDACTRAGNAGLQVILDAHNYGRYDQSGTVRVLGDGVLTQAHLADFWSKMAAAFQTHPAVLGYGIMNEPHDLGEGGADLTSPTTRYTFDTTAEGWTGEAGNTVTRITATVHDGAGALQNSKAMTAGTDLMRFNDASGLADDISAAGPSLAAWVLVPAGTPGTGWKAHIEVQNSSFSWQAGPNHDLTPGTWRLISYTPAAGLLANCRAVGFQFEATGVNSTRTVVVDTIRQGTWHSTWENASQAVVTAIRTAESGGIKKMIFVGGDAWSGVNQFGTGGAHLTPWITDSGSNFRYEAHQYMDSDGSGDYPDTYATEVSLAAGLGFLPDAEPPGPPTPAAASWLPQGQYNPNNHNTTTVYNALVGRTGARVWSFRYELMDRNNNRIMDLEEVLEGKVEWQYLADIKRQGTFRVRDLGRVNYLSDRLRPWVRLHLPPYGTSDYVEWPMGMFLLSSPSRHAGEVDTVDREVEAFDPTQVMEDDKITARFALAAGANLVNSALTQVTTSGAIPNSTLWYLVTRSNETLTATKEWTPGTSRRQICNDLLAQAEYESISFDGLGRAILKPYVDPNTRTATWTYRYGDEGLIIPDVDQELDLFSVPNKVVIVVSEPDQPMLVATATNSNPASITSTVRRGRTIVDFRDAEEAASQTVLNARALRYLREHAQTYEHLVFQTGLMPLHGLNDILHIDYDPLGINTKYSETSWTIELKAGAPMRHEARRLVSV